MKGQDRWCPLTAHHHLEFLVKFSLPSLAKVRRPRRLEFSFSPLTLDVQ